MLNHRSCRLWCRMREGEGKVYITQMTHGVVFYMRSPTVGYFCAVAASFYVVALTALVLCVLLGIPV